MRSPFFQESGINKNRMKVLHILLILSLVAFPVLSQADEEIETYLRENVWGYRSKSGIQIGKPVFSMACPFSEGKAAIEFKGRGGFLKKDGTFQTFPNAMPLGVFSSGLIPVKRFGTYGFMNHEYKFVIPETYDYASSFEKGQAKVCNRVNGNYLCGFIDTTGKILLPLEYGRLNVFSENTFSYYDYNTRMYGLVRKSGESLETKSFYYFQAVSASRAIVLTERGGKWGIFGSDGSYILTPTYDYIFPTSEERIPFMEKKKWGYLDSSGKVLISPRFDWAYTFNEGIAGVILDRKVGFIRENGEYLVSPQYALSFAEHMAIIGDGHFGHYSGFSEGLAGVYQDTNGDGIGDKMGYIDSSGNVVLDFQYEAGGAFRDGKAVVIQNKIRKTIDKQGKEVESKTSRLDPEFFPKSCKLEAPY
ncbi:hypothetical protein LEP1GSC061_2718 [Leptospira wolffii serovar Khorat str. Khorat-H2]|nr:hypothetical protein LEP1GSC061_2718 [Leptospira wolffii serovar Khorat str. Khorat-H2]